MKPEARTTHLYLHGLIACGIPGIYVCCSEFWLLMYMEDNLLWIISNQDI